MKLKDLIGQAKEELKSQKEQKGVEAVKTSLLNIESAERTLTAMKKKYEELLEKDVEEIDEELEY